MSPRERVGKADTEGLPLPCPLPLLVGVREAPPTVSVGGIEGNAVPVPVPLGHPDRDGEGVLVGSPVLCPDPVGKMDCAGEAVSTPVPV